MSDNLKELENEVDVYIDPNGAPNSILALNHNTLLKTAISKAGKFTGFYFTAYKQQNVLSTGRLSFEGNALNNTSNFEIKISNKTLDLNELSAVLNVLITGSLLKIKDYSGRSSIFEFVSYLEETDLSGNDIFTITVKGFSDNPNYIYQDSEVSLCGIDFILKVKAASVSEVVTGTSDYLFVTPFNLNGAKNDPNFHKYSFLVDNTTTDLLLMSYNPSTGTYSRSFRVSEQSRVIDDADLTTPCENASDRTLAEAPDTQIETSPGVFEDKYPTEQSYYDYIVESFFCRDNQNEVTIEPLTINKEFNVGSRFVSGEFEYNCKSTINVINRLYRESQYTEWIELTILDGTSITDNSVSTLNYQKPLIGGLVEFAMLNNIIYRVVYDVSELNSDTVYFNSLNGTISVNSNVSGNQLIYVKCLK